MTQNQSRAVLAIATGKPVYIQMAVNLARSFKWWHKDSSIKFFLATDQKNLLPNDLSDIEIIEVQSGQYGQGFSPKLHLDKLAPAQQTLFIDADCLCVGSLESVFNRFAGRAVSVVGTTISQGEWFGNVAAVCQRFGVPALPKFNGGIYYLEKGEESDRIYAKARELEPQYDEIGLVRLRNRPNDELLMAIAMALHNQTPILDDGSIMSDPQACQGGVFIDVLKGKSKLINPPAPNPKHQAWYPFTEVNPVVVHFLDYYTAIYPYTREELRLELVSAKKWSVCAADMWTTLFCSIPNVSVRTFKDGLRPIYRKLFGTNSVSVSNRI
ncbi:hypothetical protein DSM106972_024440 [Dulcicalothrix desertica PCC 7102]|uniref:Glycosyl transferase n=1 Tax=Dulcicalothrix desertica PCC 7102 TaxID=232991 RepID=A0A3S1CQ85_9CYAN|nr:hypothetical protein [Dulcicalothrix desertica]RUT07183.1 hypothetical protein DSM106972_024440 [Dulcicalothrix desertica PCC 7102]TWH61822.1 hypothetical protein CAL7102_00499 [Dulcicalothrix desertica PCC 7102]